MGGRLFISHANEDGATVERIVGYLEARGVPCWIASRDIPPRAIYAEAITEGMRDSNACGVIVSASANASSAIKRELELASHYNKPFIPIRIDDTEPGPGLDYYLRNTQWMNFARDGDRALDRIATHMADGQAPPAAAPPVAVMPATPPPVPPKSNNALFAIAAIAFAALIGVGGFLWLNQQGAPTETAEAPAATAPAVSEEPPAPLPADATDAEREALRRERDEALAAARTAEERLAIEQRLREASSRVTPPPRPPTRVLWPRPQLSADGPVQCLRAARAPIAGRSTPTGRSWNATATPGHGVRTATS